MNKIELISAISDKSKLTKSDSELALNAMIEAISQALENEDKVQLIGFGSFEVKKRAARTGYNPVKKEKIDIPESKVPYFKPGKALKNLVSK